MKELGETEPVVGVNAGHRETDRDRDHDPGGPVDQALEQLQGQGRTDQAHQGQVDSPADQVTEARGDELDQEADQRWNEGEGERVNDDLRGRIAPCHEELGVVAEQGEHRLQEGQGPQGSQMSRSEEQRGADDLSAAFEASLTDSGF